jgi:hypothetical protein
VDDHVRLRSIGDLLEWDIAACCPGCLDRVIERYPLDERLLDDLPIMLVPMPAAVQSHAEWDCSAGLGSRGTSTAWAGVPD